MGQKGRPTFLEERIEIGERWKEGQNDPEIAKAMDRSVWTIRKWRRAYQREGRSGMSPKMGRPPIGALGQYSCLSEDGENEFRFPAKGLTKDELMNEINPFLNAPEHQLKLPFSMSAWREAMIATEIGGTTLSDNTKCHAV